jgi:hypothetical protein
MQLEIDAKREKVASMIGLVCTYYFRRAMTCPYFYVHPTPSRQLEAYPSEGSFQPMRRPNAKFILAEYDKNTAHAPNPAINDARG